MYSSLKLLGQFSPELNGIFCQKGIANLVKWFSTIEQDRRYAHIR